jgi:toxin-antitoxin system PIN domain toxin
MLLIDAGVLACSHRTDAADHPLFRAYVETLANGDAAFGLSELVLERFVLLVTHPRIWVRPSPIALALDFVGDLKARPNCVQIAPGPRHWAIFDRLCRGGGVQGRLVPDAYLAALAIESGSDWITTDRGYARFPGLRWRHPLAGTASS